MTVHHCEWHLCKCHLWVTPDPFHIMILRLIWPHNLHICSTLTLISLLYFSVQFSSVSQLCLTLCDPMNSSTPGLSVHHQLPESTQTHVHWVSDAIQPSHPLSSPSPPAFNLSQHQGHFSNESAFRIRWPKYWSFNFNTQDWSPGWTGCISLQSKGLSRVFSNTTVQKHQFFSTQLSF